MSHSTASRDGEGTTGGELGMKTMGKGVKGKFGDRINDETEGERFSKKCTTNYSL